jgi:hypothetical protein
VYILAVVGGDMILYADPLCDMEKQWSISWYTTMLNILFYIYLILSIKSILNIVSITSVKCGWKR